MLNEALKLARLGLHVFPLQPRMKEPFPNPPGVEKGEGGCKLATNDSDALNRWYYQLRQRNCHNPNLGITLGKSGLVCLDIDYNHGADRNFLAKLLAQNPTVVTRTSNGHHVYYLWEEGITSHVIQPGPKVGEDAIFLRAGNMYMVAPPSIHPSGAEYRYEDHIGFPDGGLSFFNLKPASLPEEIKRIVSKTQARPKSYGPNSRHDMFKRTAVALAAKGKSIDEIMEELHRRNLENCSPPKPDCDKELRGIAEWAVAKVEVKEKREEVDACKRIEKPSAYQIAVDMAEDLKYRCTDISGLRYYRQDFYQYRNGSYELLCNETLKAEVSQWCVENGLSSIVGTDKINNVINCLKMRPILVDRDVELPCIIDGNDTIPGKHLLPLKNGLLNVEEYIKTGDAKLLPHGADFFSLYKLPYDFDPNAKCPTYDAIALSTFESAEKKELWEEIMGIHLFSPFILEHFFVLQGQGSNGKSVLVNILTNLLGESNISSIPLECFHPENFSFAKTYGKLANIISDQHDIENINEGLVKQFVTREPMTFNRKFKDPFTARPTAYLTICTNALPRFNDKTDGIWRRLVLFQLKKQVEESKRDARFVHPNFWKESGELSGILNLAIKGIARVMKNGRLSYNASLQEEMKAYREELDNVTQFAKQNLILDKHARVSSSLVYRAYTSMTHANGEKPVALRTFKRRLLEYAAREKLYLEHKDQVKINGRNISGWLGAELNRDSEFSPEPAF